MIDYQCPSCGGICKKSRCERADVSAKTLTDEEIWKCHDETDSDNWVIDFARAILRKASEK